MGVLIMAIELIRYQGKTVAPKKDVDLNKRTFSRNGFLSGCALSHIGSNIVRITAGKGIAQGADFEVLQEDISVVLPSGAVGGTFGWLYIKIDLSDLVTPISFKSVLEIDGYEPDWVQNANFYETNGVFELPILQYYATQVAIIEIFQKATYITGTLSSIESNEATDYDKTLTYAKGVIIRYTNNGYLYKSKQAITAGQDPISFSNFWEKISFGNELMKPKQAPTGTVATVATSLTNGQVFTAPSNGVYEVRATFSTSAGYIIYALSNGQGGTVNSTANNGYGHYAEININEGQTLTMSNVFSIATVTVKFFPMV